MADDVLPGAVKERLGPFPVWVWGAALGVIIVAYVWWTGRDTGSASDTSTDSGDGDGTTSAISDAIDGAFKWSGANPTGNDESVDEPVDSNTAWGIRAVAALVGKGVSPLAAQTAIGRYLAEDELTDAQQQLVNNAIVAIGQPPVPVKINVPDATDNSKIKSWERLNDGTFRTLMADGKYVARSISDYIAAGRPKLSINSYEHQTYKVPSNGTTVAQVAAKYGTSVDNIMILNSWSTVPNLTKGKRIKVPSIKGTGK